MKKKITGPARGSAIRFKPGRKVMALPGESILNAAWRSGTPLESPCGGQGWCGRCRVQVAPPSPPSVKDEKAFTTEEIAGGWRLACRAIPSVDTTVSLPPGGKAPILIPGPPIPHVRAASTQSGEYGFAVDLGTTTLAAQLWEIGTGRLVGAAGALNPQASWGSDVISRISAASRRGTFNRLSTSLRQGLSSLLREILAEHKLPLSAVREIVVAGNPAMAHFFARRDPSSLARAPFRPAFFALPPLPAAEYGLREYSRAAVRLLPGASAFVGGDAVAGVLALLPLARKRPVLLIDMGTNAEIVLLRSRSFLATSAAAGPALEGGAISAGLQAMPGAVEEIEFRGDLVIHTLGNVTPQGICGSGLVDLVALLVRLGFVLPDGRLLTPGEGGRSPWKKISRRLVMSAGESAFTIFQLDRKSPPILLTQDDIRQVQLAKAAISAGWKCMLEKSRLRPEDVKNVYISGGFGYGLRSESLAGLGMIPQVWENRCLFPGNTSLAGSSRFLLDRNAPSRIDRIIDSLDAFHLAESPRFRDYFIDAMNFPENC